MKILKSKFFAAMFGSVVFLLTTAVLTSSGLTPPHSEGEGAEGGHHDVNGPSWTFFNPELDQIIADLKAEREAVATKEQQLNELAARLKAERAELDEALKSVRTMQQKVDRDVFRIKEDEAGNLKKLAKMYAAMEPTGAARILRELDDVIVVKILSLMKEPESAVILESFARIGEPETKRAGGISESLRAAANPKSGGAK